jgi:hypothetical protein
VRRALCIIGPMVEEVGLRRMPVAVAIASGHGRKFVGGHAARRLYVVVACSASGTVAPCRALSRSVIPRVCLVPGVWESGYLGAGRYRVPRDSAIPHNPAFRRSFEHG